MPLPKEQPLSAQQRHPPPMTWGQLKSHHPSVSQLTEHWHRPLSSLASTCSRSTLRPETRLCHAALGPINTSHLHPRLEADGGAVKGSA